MAAELLTIAELKAAVHGSGSALYADAAYQGIADAAEQLVLEYVDDVPTGSTITDTYGTVEPVKLAVLQLAVELFQVRHSASSSGVSVDLSPYRLGRTLVSRYAGLLAPWSDTATMVG